MSNKYNIDSLEGEIWKDIKDFDGMYQVSSLGRFKSLPRMKKCGKYGKFMHNGFIMKQNERKGYLSILLYKSNDYKIKLPSHVLVAKYFIDNDTNKRTVNHINGNKMDNKMSNLEWLTDSEQQLHAVSIGLRKNTLGEKSNFSKLTEDAVLKIRELYKEGNITMKQISKIFDISENNIGCIVNRLTWKHI